jgi:hypothetical protein
MGDCLKGSAGGEGGEKGILRGEEVGGIEMV